MDTTKDYYSILGVLPSIDQAALGAVYRALMKKYHPDVCGGDKGEAERISKEFNKAYEILGDTVSRAAYDNARKAKNANAGDYESQSANDTEGSGTKDEDITRDWDFVARYHPTAEEERKKLAAISRALAFAFQMSILEAKTADEARSIGALMKKEFLNRFFGSNKIIHEFVLEAIAANRRDVVLEVNRAIKVLGTPTTSSQQMFMAQVMKKCNWHKDHRPDIDAGPDIREPERSSGIMVGCLGVWVILAIVGLAIGLAIIASIN